MPRQRRTPPAPRSPAQPAGRERGISDEEGVPEKVWRQLFDHASEPQLVTDPEGRVLSVNLAAIRLLESVECPLLGSSVLALAGESDRPRLRALLQRLHGDHPGSLESEVSLRVGGDESTNVSLTLLGLRDEADRLQAVSWILRQVGKPRTLVGSLQRTKQEASDLRRVLDQAAAVLELDRAGRVSEVNERATRFLGRAREEVVGCTVAELGLGSRLEESLPEIRRVLMRGRAWGGELPVVVADGKLRWVNATAVPLLDEDGQPRGYLVLSHDATRRRQALERLEQQRGLARLGSMAAIVAHEVRNPLAAAKGALEVIGPRIPSENDREVVVDVIERLSHLNQLVAEILLYARPRPLRLEAGDLGDLVERVIDELRDDPGMAGIEISLERTPDCDLLHDPGAVRGVLVNLLQNAAAAMEGGGRVQVTVEQDGDWCRLRVRDEGGGIPEELRERIFEPFFTTRHRGSGLGLAVARHAVEQHGGRLRLEPAPGGGTDALVDLPVKTPVSLPRADG